MKFEFNWPSGFREEDVWKCRRTTDGRRTDDGRRSHWYTNSSPWSLRLRWANKIQYGHLKTDKTKTLMTNGSLMKVESIAECSPWSILQYFWPALRDNQLLKTTFGLLFEWQLKTGFTISPKSTYKFIFFTEHLILRLLLFQVHDFGTAFWPHCVHCSKVLESWCQTSVCLVYVDQGLK